jgi:hypothetical protein
VGCSSQLISYHIMSIEGGKFGGCACTYLSPSTTATTMSSHVAAYLPTYLPTHPPRQPSLASHDTTHPRHPRHAYPARAHTAADPDITVTMHMPTRALASGRGWGRVQEGWVSWTCMPR